MTVWFDKDRQAWRYHFRLRGKRHTGYCIHPGTDRPAQNKREARAVEEEVRVALRRQSPESAAAPATPTAWTVAEGFADWCDSVARHKRNWRTVKGRVAELIRWLGPDRPLAEIDATLAWEYIRWARQQKVRIYVGCKAGLDRWRDTDRLRSDSTVNRYIDALRAMLNHAHRQRDPVTRQRRLAETPDLPNLDEPEELPNPVRPEHAKAILKHAAPHLYDGICLAVHLGLRLNEILRLEDSPRLDLANRVLLLDSRSKSKRGAVVFINEFAYQILARLVEEARKARQTRLILYRGAYNNLKPRPIGSFRTAWEGAHKRAGISPVYRFHDLRGNFATELARRGAHFKAVQKAARHGDIRTTLRYIAVVDDDQRAAVEALSDYEGTAVARPAPREKDRPMRTRNAHTARERRQRRIG